MASTPERRGGRVSSPKLRKSLEQAEDFLGLEEQTNRYDLLILVKRAGKAAGFTPRMTELLDYYMSFTREIDWEEGHSPIVYQSISRTALDLGITERQIQRLEQALFEVGAVTWHDSGNHRRYGQRCPETGEILYAYGVDLTPLAYLKEELEQKLARKKAHDRMWMETKRQISWYRRQILSTLAELDGEGGIHIEKVSRLEEAYEEMARPIRTHIGIESLQAMLAAHKELHERVLAVIEDEEKTAISCGKSIKMSFIDATDVVHYNYTNQIQSNELDTGKASPVCFQGRRNSGQGGKSQPEEKREAPPSQSEEKPQQGKFSIADTGLQHITISQALNATSDRFKEHLPLTFDTMSWREFVDAAGRLRPALGISQQSWGNACVALGRTGAAICVLLTDQAALRENDPVTKPAGYFNALVKRAGMGELHLHKSIFGILRREEEASFG
ncbi:plasmid replication protein RepC [Luteolibacter algae]